MTHRELIGAFHAAFLARDVDALCALYADDAVNIQAPDSPLRGKDAIRRSFETFFAAFPGEQTEVVNVIADGEWVAWEWLGGPPGDAPTMMGCGFFQVKNGKIMLQRGYWDQLTFLRTHGLPLPP
jgi:ketosteroid isomerase-like protein